MNIGSFAGIDGELEMCVNVFGVQKLHKCLRGKLANQPPSNTQRPPAPQSTAANGDAEEKQANNHITIDVIK